MRSDPPGLETERLWLAPLGAGHAADLHELFGDPEALTWWHHPAAGSRDGTAEIVARMAANNAATWAFGEHGSTEALGETGFVNGLEAGGHAGFGYSLRRSAWGRGVTVEASRAALDWGFREIGIARAELWIHRDNRRSRRVAEKLGCSQRAQGLFNHHGTLAARTVYGITAAEWRGEPEWAEHYGVEPVLAVTDVARAAGWWAQVLGFRTSFLYGDPPTHGGVATRPGWAGTTGVQLSLRPAGETGRGTVYVAVPDADAVAARARDAEATILSGPTDLPWGQRQVELADPDGNHVRVAAPIIR
jgi:RimJ/RimL family protein N-acetyltransferase/predicted enzyme related to lactoylglutathione lyase